MTGPLQALVARYDRLAATGEVPAYGYSWEKISYALVIGQDGGLLDVQPLLNTSGKKPQPTLWLVPQATKRSGTEPKPFFLWDNAKFALGAAFDKKERRLVGFTRHFERFRNWHEKLLENANDTALKAFLAFLRRWSPEQTPEQLQSDTNLIFRINGYPGYLHDRLEAREIWLRQLNDDHAPIGTCLVTGTLGPIERIHLPIKIPGSKVANLSIVSFDGPAFESYGKKQGENAPTSKAAAFGYVTCLNALARRGSRNVVRIGDATVVFWADVPEAEDIARAWFDLPPDEKTEVAAIRDVLEQMARGRPIREVRPDIAEETRFYVLGLSPNAARLSVRFWHETTFGDLARRFQEHWQDLRLEPSDWGGALPALWRLLYELAPQGKAENVPAHLAGELTRSVLTGGPYPRTLLAAALMRMRADRAVNGRRAAICKAVIVRALRRDDPSSVEENHLVSLDRNETNQGYRLGRLFAALEGIQRTALGRGVNATIRDRYYGAASATPAAVFPILIRNANHHLAGIRKSRGGGLAHALERGMGEILEGFGAAFPRHLAIEDQGRFAIGYYHERFGRAAETADETTSDDATDGEG
jgi:CRISPR-associated protein Csd1